VEEKIRELLDKLQIANQDLISLRDKVGVCLDTGDQQKAREILKSLKTDNAISDCDCFDHHPFCAFFSGTLEYYLASYAEAVDDFDSARARFSASGEEWNEAIAWSSLAGTYPMLPEPDLQRSIHAYENAIHRLRQIKRLNPNRKDIKAIQELIVELEAECARVLAANKSKKRPAARSASSPAARPSREKTGSIRLPWIGLYSTVQAGPGGPIWPEPDLGSDVPTLDTVKFEGREFKIHSINEFDGEIKLNHSRKYGWLKVRGDSMEGADPIHIFDGDYLLFEQSESAENGAIVIAAIPDEAGSGDMLWVKRFDKINRQFLSESIPANKYAPIPCTKKTRILGTVLAVLKSA
jgi:tetratricopeptide (TPR) repeat protein